MHKHHIIYKSVCDTTNQYYIGMHSTSDLFDGYQGSGLLIRRMLKAGYKFTTIILEHCASRDELSTQESIMITPEVLADPLCLNLIPGGYDGARYANRKLTDYDVAKIKFSTASNNEIADAYSISPVSVIYYRSGKVHSDITEYHLNGESPFIGTTVNKTNTVLSDVEKAMIKFSTATQQELSDIFKVSIPMVRSIQRGIKSPYITKEHLCGELAYVGITKKRVRLSVDTVAFIKFSNVPPKVLAMKYNTTEDNISKIRTGKSHKNVTREHLKQHII